MKTLAALEDVVPRLNSIGKILWPKQVDLAQGGCYTLRILRISSRACNFAGTEKA